MPDYIDQLTQWRAWRDITARAVATAYQAFVAIVLAGLASGQVADLSLWVKALTAALAAALTVGQRVAQRVLSTLDNREGQRTLP